MTLDPETAINDALAELTVCVSTPPGERVPHVELECADPYAVLVALSMIAGAVIRQLGRELDVDPMFAVRVAAQSFQRGFAGLDEDDST